MDNDDIHAQLFYLLVLHFNFSIILVDKTELRQVNERYTSTTKRKNTSTIN